LTWESFLFNYHKSVCFIIQENYSKRNNQYIIKTPEFPPHQESKILTHIAAIDLQPSDFKKYPF